ncbi:AI-2E family transporter [Rubinisphaera sp. JC750]|uniref:AI-2E family transporter n=1 Tax=Rubinisphaera sp. JC750 TaxID=2898658 RepID=UPI001F444A1C|nr:AI-2E family transporter [Rubinisphaera sp. JC750]
MNEPSTSNWDDKHLWQIAFIRDLFWFGLIFAFLWCCIYLRDVLLPVLVGFGLAYALNPALELFNRRWNVPRYVTLAILYVLIVLIIAGVGFFLGPIFVEEAEQFADKLPGQIDQLKQTFVSSEPLGGTLQKAKESLEQSKGSLASSATQKLGDGFGWLARVVGVTGYVLFCLLTIPIFLFYFGWQFAETKDLLKSFIPSRYRESTLDMLSKMDKVVGQYIRGRIICSLFQIVFYSAGWALVGVPYALVLGTVTGILGTIPWAAGLGWPVAMLLAYLDIVQGGGGESVLLWAFFWPSVVYFTVQILENYVLEPWIQSSQTSLGPITIIVAILIGGSVAGFFGLLLAVPIAGSGKILFQEVIFPRLENWANHEE